MNWNWRLILNNNNKKLDTDSEMETVKISFPLRSWQNWKKMLISFYPTNFLNSSFDNENKKRIIIIYHDVRLQDTDCL